MAFQTTLIIGLGGVGSAIVERIYKKFEATNPSDVDRRNVAFLCLDTDKNDIKKHLEVMPSGTVVQTSSDLSCTIGGYIDQIKSKTTVLDWFDTKSQQLLSLPIDEGAAQVRMASRLASISAINEGKFAAIDNSITYLLSTEPERHRGNNVKIHIVCSLAGGTGAGSFLQTAYYIKNAMKEHNATAPKISGYFLLADVLCCDSNVGLSEGQKENVRSNTYACVKELNAFCNSDKEHQVRNIQFEYRLGQKSKELPVDVPYDFCFLVDYFGANGGNLIKEKRYEEQATEFIYMNAFDPIGDNYRQKAINDIRQKIEQEGASRFAAFGVSKLVYPVDDLMSYFARQRVVDNLNGTWLRIDKDFDERYAEYKKNIEQGIRVEEPNKGKHFMQQVEVLGKTGAGREGMEFRRILESTKIYPEGKDIGIPKAKVYLDCVESYVAGLVQSSSELSGLYATCTVTNPNFTKNTGSDNDLGFVVRRERELEEYRKAVINFIDSTKSAAIKQCLVVDHDVENFVSKNPQADGNHLNTYILEKEKEMHPLAVRYMLYEIQAMLKMGLEKKKAENKKLGTMINETYKKLFDDPETKDRVEDARESLKRANARNSGIRLISSLFSGQNPYKAAKENYESKSRQQAENIHKYAREKLLEETYAGLLMQINLLIEEEENFFKSLPNAIYEVDSSLSSLLKKHDANNNPCISYVLASEQNKKDIYEFVISRKDSPFFPSEISAALYRSMFENTVNALEKNGFATSRKKSSAAMKAERLKANRKIIEECIKFQEEIIREKNKEYAELNVLKALKEEAMRECDNDEKAAHEYWIKKFHAFRDRAEIWGASNLDKDVRYINAWGVNPECLDSDTITENEADELFGDKNVDTNEKTAATLVESDKFLPFEICRVNAATLLVVEKNFKGFLSTERTELAEESVGTYYAAYMKVVDKVNMMNSKTYSPHLDKHWHLPAYMPNIGFTQADEIERVFKALYWGLLLGMFKSESRGGDNYWKYVGEYSCFIQDVDNNMILTGNSVKYALDRLFQGLTTNPAIVDQVLNAADEWWNNARDLWLQKEYDEDVELEKMKKFNTVQAILNFTFKIVHGDNKRSSWFSILTSKPNMLLDKFLSLDGERLRVGFFDELMNRLIALFGPSKNTNKVCEYIVKHVDKDCSDLAEARLSVFEKQNRFQPTV